MCWRTEGFRKSSLRYFIVWKMMTGENQKMHAADSMVRTVQLFGAS